MVKLFSEIMPRYWPLKCGGAAKVITSVKMQLLSKRSYLTLMKKLVVAPDLLPEDREPPQLGLFDG